MPNNDGDGGGVVSFVPITEFREYKRAQETLCSAYREAMKSEIKHGTDTIKTALAISTTIISLIIVLVNWYVQVIIG